jgi:hypothetical protein
VQQIPGGAHLLWIDMRQRKSTATDQLGDLHGIDLVILGYPPWIAFM